MGISRLNRPDRRAAWLGRLARLVMRNPRRVFIAISVITAIAAVGAFPLSVQSDLTWLLPESDPAVLALREYRAGPGGEGAVMVTLPATADRKEVERRVAALPTVKYVFAGLDGVAGLKLRLLQLEPEQIQDLTESLHAAIVFNDPDLVRRPEPPEALFPWARKMLQESDPEGADRPWTLIVVPESPPGDPEFCQRLLAGLEQAVPEAIWMAGPHVTIGESARDIRTDLTRTSAIALLLIVLVLSVAFRSPRATLLLLPPLLIADLVALSVTQAIAGSLNVYTSMGSAILLGLGVDFGIHLVSRYREERGMGHVAEDAVVRAWEATGPPCVTAGLTSSAGFLALLFADFQGVSQLGMLLGIGVLACLGMMLVTLPLLLVWLDPPPRLPGKGWPSLVTRPRRALGLYLLVTLGMVLLLPRFSVEYDISKLRREGMAWEELTPEQQELRQAAFPPVVLTTDDSEAAQEALEERVRRGDWPHVRGVVSIHRLLPSDQREHMVAIEGLVRVANHHRLKTSAIPQDSELATLRSMDATPMTLEDLPESLRYLLGADYQRVFLLLRGNMADLREAQALSTEITELSEHAANEFLAQASMIGLITDDLPRITGLALLVVIVIVILDLRRTGPVVIAVSGLLFSLVWAAGALVAANVQINLFNVIALPMMLGIGIDTLVHLLHRLEEQADTAAALRSTGVAALLSTLTSVAAFYALTLAVSRGVRSIGEAVVVGLTAVFLSAVIYVPAMWQLLRGRAHEAPGAAP